MGFDQNVRNRGFSGITLLGQEYSGFPYLSGLTRDLTEAGISLLFREYHT